MRKRPLCFVLLVFLLIQSVKIIWMNGQTLVKVPASSIFSEHETVSEALIQGQVYKRAIRTDYQVLYLKNNSITYQNQVYRESYLVVYENTFQNIKIGQYVTFQGKLTVFEEARNPGNFDKKLYYAKQKLYGSMWADNVIEVSGQARIFQERIFEFRQQWKQLFLEEMGEEKGSVLCAMLLGEKGELDADTKELYQKNGFGHLLAISGLHISFIGLGCYRILRKIGVGYGGAGIISIGILLVYVVMLGFSVSIFRAFLMLMMRIGADITGRVYDMLTALVLSAAMIVIYEPLYLVDGAFQLSHGAIAAIVIVAPVIQKLGIKESFSVSIAIHLVLLPITLWHFYEIPIYAILWNMIVIPLMSFLLGFGMLGSLYPFTDFCLTGCKIILTIYEWIGKIGSLIPGNRIVLGKPSFIAVIVFYIWLVVQIWLISHGKIYKKMFVGSLLIVGLVFVRLPDGKVTITMLDVGQGDCIYVRGPYGNDYLIDGGSSDVDQLGKYAIEPFLKSQGVGSLEYVFVSHGDLDHYSGIKEMMERQKYGVKIKHLVFPETYVNEQALLELSALAREYEIPVLCMKQGEMLCEGDLKISCVQPGQGEKNLDGNASSLVLDLSFHKFSMLFTGDVELEGEEHLLQKLNGKRYDVLKVAHHGSKNSTSEELLNMINPKISLISAGENNTYGHPHEETLDRLQDVGSIVLETKEWGSIMLETDGFDDLKVSK